MNVSIVSNDTLDENEDVPMSSIVIVGLVLGFITIMVICGNILVLTAIAISKNLRGSTHYFIVSLACADLCLGFLVLPFSTADSALNHKWLFGKTVCAFWLACDVLCVTASILSLTAISVDRYVGVTRPLQHPSIISGRRTIIAITVIWILAFSISFIPFFGWRPPESEQNENECPVNTELGYVIFSALCSFYIPASIITGLYYQIYRAVVHRSRSIDSGFKRTKSGRHFSMRIHIRSKKNLDNNNKFEKIGRVQSLPPTKNPPQQSEDTKKNLLLNDNTPIVENNVDATNNKSESDYDDSYIPSDNATSSLPDDYGGRQTNKKFPKQRRFIPNTASNSQRNKENNDKQVVANRSDKKDDDVKATAQNKQQSSGSKKHSKSMFLRRIPMLSGAQRRPAIMKGHSGLGGLRSTKMKLQAKAAKTLGIVVGVFIVCWLPFFVEIVVEAVCENVFETECHPGEPWFSIIFWLGYCNSMINPFIYAASSREFRNAFRRILLPIFFCFTFRRINTSTTIHYHQSPHHRYQNTYTIKEAFLDCCCCCMPFVQKKNASTTNPPFLMTEYHSETGSQRGGGGYRFNTTNVNNNDQIILKSKRPSRRKSINDSVRNTSTLGRHGKIERGGSVYTKKAESIVHNQGHRLSCINVPLSSSNRLSIEHGQSYTTATSTTSHKSNAQVSDITSSEDNFNSPLNSRKTAYHNQQHLIVPPVHPSLSSAEVIVPDDSTTKEDSSRESTPTKSSLANRRRTSPSHKTPSLKLLLSRGQYNTSSVDSSDITILDNNNCSVVGAADENSIQSQTSTKDYKEMAAPLNDGESFDSSQIFSPMSQNDESALEHKNITSDSNTVSSSDKTCETFLTSSTTPDAYVNNSTAISPNNINETTKCMIDNEVRKCRDSDFIFVMTEPKQEQPRQPFDKVVMLARIPETSIDKEDGSEISMERYSGDSWV